MVNFIGLQYDDLGYRMQQIVSDEEGTQLLKRSKIMSWVVLETSTEIIRIPNSKLDSEMNTYIAPSQLNTRLSDHTRILFKKTAKGMEVICPGVIIEPK